MKKYITTDKHPELKAGLQLFYSERNKQYVTNYYLVGIIPEDISIMVKKGWVKQLQEPKWTDQDMIDFSRKVYPNFKIEYHEACLKQFKEERS